MFAEPAWIAVAGGRLPLWRAGEGDGPLLLFIHGWTLDARIWTPQFDGLAAHHRLAAFDRRGFGRSDAPPDPTAEVDDLVVLLDALEEAAVIVGQSQGARSALALAARHPARVRGLILAGAPFPWTLPAHVPAEAAPMEEMRGHALRGDWAALRATWAGHALLAMPGADGAAGALLDEVIEAYRGSDLIAQRPALQLSQEAIAALRVPVLAVTGDRDSVLRQAAADAIAALIPGACRAWVKGAGHLCTLSHPDRFNAMVGTFLATL